MFNLEMGNHMKDKVAIITGASSGIGEAAARMFAEAGASVMLAARREKVLEEIVSSLASAGLKADYAVCDVTDEAQVEAMVKKTVRRFGRLDCAFNNAGIMPDDIETADLPAPEFDRVISANLRSVFLCMKYELGEMLKNGKDGGAIVNDSSIGGIIGMPGRAAYHASKHGVIGLTKCAALEYATRNIRINAVCPATIKTPMVERMMKSGAITDIIEPMGRMGRPEEVAAAVLWLCGPGAGFITGQSIPVDGGYTAK